jgi:hypothetical protein
VAPYPHQRARNPALFSEGRKEVIYPTKRTLQGVTFPAYSSLRKTAGPPQEKNQNPNYRGTSDKNPTPKQLQMYKSQCRMKEQDNCSPSEYQFHQ